MLRTSKLFIALLSAGLCLTLSCGRDTISDPFQDQNDPLNTTDTINPPTELVAESGGSDSINLSWKDNSSNENGFKIERSSSAAGEFQHLGVVTAGITSFTNEGLSADTSYFYRVLAYNLDGVSKPSNVADAKTDEVNTDPPDETESPVLSSIDTNPVTAGLQNEITLKASTLYDFEFHGEKFMESSKVVFKFGGAVKFERENNQVHINPSSDDILDIDDVPVASFDSIGTWSAYVKNDDTHISAEKTFVVKGEMVEFSLNPTISSSQLTPVLPAGTYEVKLDYNSNYPDSYNAEHNWAAQAEEYKCVSWFGSRCNRYDWVPSRFCYNAVFEGVNFHDPAKGIEFETDLDAFLEYKTHSISVILDESGTISARFLDLFDDQDYSDNAGLLHFIIQRTH